MGRWKYGLCSSSGLGLDSFDEDLFGSCLDDSLDDSFEDSFEDSLVCLERGAGSGLLEYRRVWTLRVFAEIVFAGALEATDAVLTPLSTFDSPPFPISYIKPPGSSPLRIFLALRGGMTLFASLKACRSRALAHNTSNLGREANCRRLDETSGS